MGLKEVQIKLDNSNNTYYAGQTVNGVVVFEFDSPKKVRGRCENCVLYVKFSSGISYAIFLMQLLLVCDRVGVRGVS